MSSVSGAHRDSGIVGLEDGERPEGVMVLGVDPVTDDSNVDVGGEPIGEGPGRYGGTGLIGLAAETGGSGTSADRSDGGNSLDIGNSLDSDNSLDSGNSLDKKEGLDTDPGSGTSLADILVETGEMLPMSEGELIVGKSSGGEGGNPCSMRITGGSGIGSGEVTRTTSAGSALGRGGSRGGMAT